jgi:hypothetical protein
MQRRRFIALAGMSALAGCGSDGSDSDGAVDSTAKTDATPTRAETNSPESPTDTPTPTPTSEPAAFELVSYDAPETVEIGADFTMEITIRNVGGQTGTYEDQLYVRGPESDWVESGSWTFTDVGAGETATASFTEPVRFDYLTRYEFRLGTFAETTAVQTVSATVTWGGEYTTPAGYRIRVEQPDVQPTYESEDYDGTIVDVEPENGGQWAFVTIWVKNEAGQANYSPLASEFGLLYGSKQADGETILVDDPINRDDPFDGGELQPGVERRGWIAFQVPDDLDVADLTMAWSQETYNGQIGVRWGSEE